MMGLAAIGITIFLSMFGFWWRVESRQDKKIDGLRNFNDKDHREICKEILAARDLSVKQHMMLRDKLDEVWKDLIRRNGGK